VGGGFREKKLEPVFFPSKSATSLNFLLRERKNLNWVKARGGPFLIVNLTCESGGRDNGGEGRARVEGGTGRWRGGTYSFCNVSKGEGETVCARKGAYNRTRNTVVPRRIRRIRKFYEFRLLGLQRRVMGQRLEGAQKQT